jgi:hypothetical protein
MFRVSPRTKLVLGFVPSPIDDSQGWVHLEPWDSVRPYNTDGPLSYNLL